MEQISENGPFGPQLNAPGGIGGMQLSYREYSAHVIVAWQLLDWAIEQMLNIITQNIDRIVILVIPPPLVRKQSCAVDKDTTHSVACASHESFKRQRTISEERAVENKKMNLVPNSEQRFPNWSKIDLDSF